VSADYPVTGRSDSVVKATAKKARASFAIVREGRVDLTATLQQETIWTTFGRKNLGFEVCDDKELPRSEGVTEFRPGAVTIKLKRSTFERLKVGEGRAANTAAHEIGHAVLHDGPPMHRLALAGSKVHWIRPYESAEHQAKVFAPAFLIDDRIAENLPNAEEISVAFGVSYESAEIWIRERQEERKRPQIAENIKRFATEFGATNEPTMSYLSARCPNCGERTIFPVGVKYMCQTCDRVFDGFQDGDALED
jgi:DNA-directed RNA polymerase subunit RPC12/RpoP